MAVYQNAHVKVSIIGDCFGGAEEWSTGFRVGTVAAGGGNFDVSQAWLDEIAGTWATYFALSANGYSTQYRTTQLKAGIVLPDTGKFDLSTIKTHTYTSPVAGTSGGSWHPPQVSLVAQLASANPRELGGKGRMYLPGINFPINTNAKLSTTENQRIADNLRTWLDSIEVATDSPGYVMIASKGRVGVPFAAPVNRRVATVRVGDVYDTQRRRRNQLSETYFSASLNGAP